MTALLRLHFKPLLGALLLLVLSLGASAQNREVTGKVIDKDGKPASGISVTAKGTRTGTQTGADGSFRLSIPASVSTLVFSGVGFEKEEVSVAGKDAVEVTLQNNNTSIGEVVVIGYGTARKKDLTGSVASVKAKDFNKGVQTAADQLIQGKLAGVQVLNNSGAPGGATSIKIRGNASVRAGNQPLFVVDGVPLDGRSARPGVNALQLGNTPDGNPLNFINPADIASMDVLKDASATAIFGSRGANGVVIITTKKGQAGLPKLEFSYSQGFSSIMKRLDVLTGDEMRAARAKYGLNNTTYTDNVNALDAILRTGRTENVNVSFGGGNDANRYRVSLGYISQQGIINNSGFKRFSANISGSAKFMESKRLGIDYNIIASQNQESIVPISNDAGFEGSLVGQALQWNPGLSLKNADGSPRQRDSSNNVYNPVALLTYYSDRSKLSNIFASVSPYFKITKDLEYKLMYSINYGTGVRRSSTNKKIIFNDINGKGWANYGNNELITQQLTHTLSYNKQVTSSLNLNALIGYEYLKFENKGNSISGRGFGDYDLDYTDYLQYSAQGNRTFNSFNDPTNELQSYFARVVGNFRDKYIVTATVRADGSSKFGENNKYGVFPSVGAAWNISNEDFFQGIKGNLISNLKLRLNWGLTGNQEFPAGSAQTRYGFRNPDGGATNPGDITVINYENKDLQWQTDQQSAVGLDFDLLKGRITGSIDYFNKKTKKLLFAGTLPVPGPGGTLWQNIDGTIINKGLEFAVNAVLVKKEDFMWNLGLNATFLKNTVKDLKAPIETGGLHGAGITGTRIQLITNGQPINTFYVRDYRGIDGTGQASFVDDGNTFYFLGNPNPTTLLGFTTSASYKKLSLEIAMNGAFGHKIYNNTANSVLPTSNLLSWKNIASNLVSLSPQEATSSPITASSRYMESGNYLKMANATLSYAIGNIGKSIKNMNVFITGQNLFVITKFSGFDPEVNTDKNVGGVPSVSIEYTPYPTARTITLGLNVSL